MQLLVLAISAHFIGDFAFQSWWMAMEKSKKNWEVLVYHVAVYTSALILAFMFYGQELPIWAIAVIFVTHILIDACKTIWKIIKHIWQDQLLHIGVLIFIVWLIQ